VTGWKKKDDTHLISIEQPKASVAEVYRTLRTSVLFASAQRGLKTLMVTSPTAGEGKTTTASNLAVVLSDAGKRVILVSSDLRKPRIHRFFGLSNEKGLSTVLAGEVKPWEAMADPGRGHLRVLTSGPVPAHPAELLQSEAMGELIEELREVADFVILDTAPVLLVADALAIAPLADGVLLVVDAENTHRGAVIQAREQLEQVGAPMIGAVLNNFDPSKARSPYYGYYGSYWHRYRYSGYYGFNYGEDGRRGTPAALPGEGRSE
jgi:capsular exopolysaccharide synthesis family protein